MLDVDEPSDLVWEEPEPFRPFSGALIAERYRLDQCLGEGRFGEVWRAADSRLENQALGMGKFVAVKFLKQEYINDPEVRADFQAEVRALYQLTHPNLLRLYDFDILPDKAYLVTEYAVGSLARHLARHGRFNLRQTADYLNQAAAGLDYAHAQKFVHRDLKPHNLLITENNRLLVADFGLAHITNLSGTRSMAEVSPSGTPAYMAPEQWDWLAGWRSDLYALGVILFQMITGRLPYKPTNGSPKEWKSLHQTAPIPSPRQFVADLPGEIEPIIQQALAKDPKDRFGSAKEMAESFRQAIAPYVESLSQRHKAAKAAQSTPPFSDTTTPISLQPPAKPVVVPLNPPSAPPAQDTRVVPNLTIHVRANQPKTTNSGASFGNTAPQENNSITPFLNRVDKPRSYVPLGTPVKTLEGHGYYVNSLAFSPDGKFLVSGSLDKTLRVWPVAGSQQEGRVLEGHSASVFCVAFSPIGNVLASGSHDKTIRLWDPENGALIRTLEGHEGSVYAVAFSPDGRLLVSASMDRTVRIWNVATGRFLADLKGHTDSVTSLAFSLDGRWLASGSKDTTIKLWDMAKGQELGAFEGHDDGVCSVAISPDGRRLLSGSMDKTAKLWDMASGESVKSLRGNNDWVLGVSFSPDGHTLAIASDCVRLWDTRKTIELKTITGHSALVNAVAFSPDGQILASASDDKQVKLWSAYRLEI